MAEPVKRMESDSLSPTGSNDCPKGFSLWLDLGLICKIQTGWNPELAHYSTSIYWPGYEVHPWQIKFLEKTRASSCLYGLYSNDLPVAIGELYIPDLSSDDNFGERKKELEKLNLLYGDFARMDLKRPANKKPKMGQKPLRWIIRKSYDSFQNTVGFREASTAQDKNAMYDLKMLASEDIARTVQTMYANDDIIWSREIHALNLADFKFYLDYPKVRAYQPIVSNSNAWVPNLWADRGDPSRSFQIYMETKEVLQRKLGVYFPREKATSYDELEEQIQKLE
ncbi:hypothetical protein FRC03_000716 [Tulasnella sp. 419]|nr:hypothetical protein FRC02_008423 [Tulasnella sp. 418]KAG8948460.1 hypothetical protein FRC03_000716 [Tulasnella sp. 419]